MKIASMNANKIELEDSENDIPQVFNDDSFTIHREANFKAKNNPKGDCLELHRDSEKTSFCDGG